MIMKTGIPTLRSELLSKVNQPVTRTALIIFFFAATLRVVFIAQTAHLPDFRTPTPGLDMCVQWEAARHIRAGTPDPCLELMLPSAPFHPYFIAFCQTILGENLMVHRVVRALLGSLSVALIFLICLHITRRKAVAALAALLVCTLPSWIYFDTMLIKASIELLMLCIGLYVVLKVPKDVSSRRAWLTGIFLGVLFSLLRFSQGATFLYVAASAAYILAGKQTALRRRLTVVAPMVLILFASQTAFKYRTPLFGASSNRFLPVSGVHMRIGFQDHAIGTYHVLQRFPALPLGHTFFSRMCAEAMAGRQLTPAEANQSYIDEATTFIKQNPVEAVRIIGRKLALFTNNLEPAGNHYLQDIQARVPVLNLPTVGYGGLFILGAVGIAALWFRRRVRLLVLLAGLIVAVLVPNLLGFVTWRYRLHATVPFAILASVAFADCMDFLQNNRYRRNTWRAVLNRKAAIVLGLIAIASFCAYRPVLKNAAPLMRVTSAKNLQQSEKRERMEAEIVELEQLRPLSSIQQARLSNLLHNVGRYTDSFREVEDIVQREPGAVFAARQYVVYLLWQGDYDTIARFMERLASEHLVALNRLLRSFESDASFWQHSDMNMKLIVQTLIRDVVLPRAKSQILSNRAQLSPDAASGS